MTPAPTVPTFRTPDTVAIPALRAACCDQLRALGLYLVAESLEDGTEPDRALVVRAALHAVSNVAAGLDAARADYTWLMLCSDTRRHLLALEEKEARRVA